MMNDKERDDYYDHIFTWPQAQLRPPVRACAALLGIAEATKDPEQRKLIVAAVTQLAIDHTVPFKEVEVMLNYHFPNGVNPH